MQLTNGTELKRGDYRILGILGQGGFGITYLALQVKLNRKVAIKEFFMKDLCNRDDDGSHVSVGSVGSKDLVERFKQKFLKEAGLIASFDNTNIIRIYDVFEENGTAYYVMEYLEGKSLKALVDESGALPEDVAVKYIRQVAEALKEVHENNLLHLDVKPANIMLDKKGNAVLIDFGISKHYDEAGHQTSSAGVGISEGYAPIEQYEAGALKTFTPVTDIYALGATLFFLLTGARPPKASYINDEGLPPMPEALSLTVRKAVESAMQPRRKDRPQSIGEFLGLVESGKCKDESEEVVTVIDDVADVYGPPPVIIDKEEKDEYDVTIIDPVSCVYGPPPFVIDKEEPEEINTSGNENKKTGKRKIVPIAAIILLLVCCVAGYFMLLGGGKKYDPNSFNYVDLGLPSGLKWADSNVGAYSPDGYGDYLDWDEAQECGLRIPTKEEFEELEEYCEWTWTTQNGVEGYKVTSKKNGNSIFLPAAGWRYGTSLNDQGIRGYYWSSTPHESNSFDAYYLDFNSVSHCTYWNRRYYGRSVRPVSGGIENKTGKTSNAKPASSKLSTRTFKANGVEFTMVAVEGGTFSMGSNDGGRNEKPIHQVALDSYCIGETEVTQALWQAIMGTTIYDQAKKGAYNNRDLYGTGDNNPMYYISYNDCIDFVNKLNTLLKDQLPQGRQFRLPTEAEWEYAARGGNKSKGCKYSGSNSISTVAWYKDNSGRKTHPVKQKASNELGLYDMSGNVYEWCSDWYGRNYDSSSPQNNPKGPGSGSSRVLRGGSWDSYEQGCRSAFRDGSDPGCRYYGYGLRLAF